MLALDERNTLQKKTNLITNPYEFFLNEYDLGGKKTKQNKNVQEII